MSDKTKPGRSLAVTLGIVLYFILILPAAFVLPPQLAWENGPIEMLQNVVLLGEAVLCGYFFRKTAGQKFHNLWLAAAGWFLLLFGREISWGRVFFPRGIDEHGPYFISMNSVPYHEYIHGAIAIYTAVVVLAILWTVPWKFALRKFPFPKIPFIVLLLASIIAACGDKGLLFHSYVDANCEELAELLVYFIQGWFVWTYYHYFKQIQ